MALSLPDRFALFLSRTPTTADGLSRIFRVPRDEAWAALDKLRRGRVVELVERGGRPLWRVRTGVSVRYRPGRIHLEAPSIDESRCTATTRAGTRCKRTATAGERCPTHR